MKRLCFRIAIALAFVHLCAPQAWAQTVHKGGRKAIENLKVRQLLVVVTDNWNDFQGKLYAFKHTRGKWTLQFSNTVVVGSNGLGWGDGIVPFSVSGTPVKKEGDKKSPAGVFTIGAAFGYADYKDAKWIRNPYIRTIDTLICVDDIQSVNYNKLVDKDTAKADYHSFEYMHRKDNYYKWGLFIRHNSDKVVPGDGSCIFMHIWENEHEGTVGCTAMKEADMLRVLHWINAKDKPLLVQMPIQNYRDLRLRYKLPAISF